MIEHDEPDDSDHPRARRRRAAPSRSRRRRPRSRPPRSSCSRTAARRRPPGRRAAQVLLAHDVGAAAAGIGRTVCRYDAITITISVRDGDGDRRPREAAAPWSLTRQQHEQDLLGRVGHRRQARPRRRPAAPGSSAAGCAPVRSLEKARPTTRRLVRPPAARDGAAVCGHARATAYAAGRRPGARDASRRLRRRRWNGTLVTTTPGSNSSSALEEQRRLVVQQVLPPMARHELGQHDGHDRVASCRCACGSPRAAAAPRSRNGASTSTSGTSSWRSCHSSTTPATSSGSVDQVDRLDRRSGAATSRRPPRGPSDRARPTRGSSTTLRSGSSGTVVEPAVARSPGTSGTSVTTTPGSNSSAVFSRKASRCTQELPATVRRVSTSGITTVTKSLGLWRGIARGRTGGRRAPGGRRRPRSDSSATHARGALDRPARAPPRRTTSGGPTYRALTRARAHRAQVGDGVLASQARGRAPAAAWCLDAACRAPVSRRACSARDHVLVVAVDGQEEQHDDRDRDDHDLRALLANFVIVTIDQHDAGGDRADAVDRPRCAATPALHARTTAAPCPPATG